MTVSLRSRVLAATVALVVGGLAVGGIATYTFLGSFLLNRVDQQLVVAEFPAANALHQTIDYGHSDAGGPPPGGIPSDTYCALLDASGHTLYQARLGHFAASPPPRPALPAGLPGSSSPSSDENRVVFTTGSSGPDYRVIALAANLGGGGRGTFVVAIPLTEVTATLHRLVLVEIGVALAVLVAVGGIGWWLVRRGLRPLDNMAGTADAITAGDLSQRVQPADEQTEVGRLGLALNTMLGRIETSFDEQRASEERLRRFIADASHELRTPLTSIRGYAELFRRGAATRPDDLERAMRRIEDEGSRMGLLVEDLLLLARLDQGRPLDQGPVELSRLVGDAVDDARAADPGRPMEFSPDGPLLVTGDEPRLRQVIANLLDNARTHTPPGTPVSIRLGSSDGRATIEVADGGPGLSPEESARVFERFYRGDPSRSRESGGTGLGLSIASAIVQAHGGMVTATSDPDHGATFTVSLPLIDDERSGGGRGSAT